MELSTKCNERFNDCYETLVVKGNCYSALKDPDHAITCF